jgi:hypothetical protein
MRNVAEFLRPETGKSMRPRLANVPILSTAADLVRRGMQAVVAGRRTKPAPVAAPHPARRSASDQWSRVAGVLTEAQSRAQRAVETHRGASDQLDAATYALLRLREEMAPAFLLTVARPAPIAPSPLRREPFRRREPLAA